MIENDGKDIGMQPFLQAIDSGLNEAFEKLKTALDGLSEDELHWRPSLESNTIDWMVWHMARAEDNWVNVRLRESDEIWNIEGWAERIGFTSESVGFGQNAEDIRAMPAFDVPILMEYYARVRQATSGYFANEMTDEALSKEITNPRYAPFSYAGILGHLLCEEAEHLGQIEYLRGMMRGLNN